MDEHARQPHTVVIVVRVEPGEDVANTADIHRLDRKIVCAGRFILDYPD